MSSQNLKELEPERLVHIIRGKKHPAELKGQAARLLEEKFKPLLAGRISNEVRDLPQFLAAVKSGAHEHFAAYVLFRAIQTWKRGRGTRFSTWLYDLVTKAIIDGLRATKHLPASLIDGEGRDTLGNRPAAPSLTDPLERLGLLEALDLARKCLAELSERWRKAFFWGVLLRMTNEEIRAVWPDESLDNVKQLKSRAAARFVVLWYLKGGAKAEGLLQNLAGAVADKVDPRRIKDKRAREAYLVWMRAGTPAAAAKAMKMDPERLRKLLLKAMHDLFEQGMYRGEGLDPAALRARENDLARYLELADGEAARDPFLARISHSLEVVRAAFGFAPVSSATHTLGSFIQSRFVKEKDYPAACKALGLTNTSLRKLLADEYEAENDFYDRLSRLLEVPADHLRGLPRRPAGDTRLALRSRPAFDQARFHKRVLAWIAR